MLDHNTNSSEPQVIERESGEDKLQEDLLKSRKLKTGLRGFLGEEEEKITNIVFLTLAAIFLLIAAFIFLPYFFDPPKDMWIEFSSIYVFLTSMATLAFGYIFGRSSQPKGK